MRASTVEWISRTTCSTTFCSLSANTTKLTLCVIFWYSDICTTGWPLFRTLRLFYCIPRRRYSAAVQLEPSSGGCLQFAPRFFGVIFGEDFVDRADFDQTSRIHESCLVADRPNEIVRMAGQNQDRALFGEFLQACRCPVGEACVPGSDALVEQEDFRFKDRGERKSEPGRHAH